MSIDSGLTFFLESYTTSPISSSTVHLMRSLVQDGWLPNDYGHVVFLPKGDDGKFEWEEVPLDEIEFVWTELEWKAANHETVGLVLTWDDEFVGGQFVVKPDMMLTVSLSINRRKTERDLTDVSWYLDRIVPTLQKFGHIYKLLWFEAR